MLAAPEGQDPAVGVACARDRYDVIIVGAGPAGAGAARALCGSGLQTLIVEKHKLPRYKMCSGIVFPSAWKFILDNFGDIPGDILCSPKRVKGSRVYVTNDAPPMDVPFSAFDDHPGQEEEGLNTWRSRLDHWLCGRSGAALMDACRFDGFEMEGRGHVVHLRHLGRKLSIRARFIIGADGTLSRVRRTAFPGFDKGVGLIPNYEECYTGAIDLEPGRLYVFMDRSITGYFATVFHKDDRIVVVTGVNQRESVKRYFEVFKTHLEKSHGLKIEEKISGRGIVLTDMSARKNYCLGRGNILLAGEAGGFLRGGEGISSSLVSGKAAGDSVLESSRSGRPAIEYYRRFSAKEAEACNRTNENMSAALSFNVFTRP